MTRSATLLCCLLVSCLLAGAETVTFTVSNSKPAGPTQAANDNADAMWVTDAGNTTLKKTFARWVGSSANPASKNGYLGLTWWRNFTTGNGEVDGFMGATRTAYGSMTGAAWAKPVWDMSLKGGGTAPDATYTIWFESATDNNPPTNAGATTTSCARYHLSFVKDGVGRTATITDTYYSGSWTYTGRVPSIANPALSIAAGASTTFTLTSNAAIAPSGYQWRKAGANLGGATASTYTIATAVVGDSGSYDCVVTYPNSYGLAAAPTMTSNALTLTVTSGTVAVTASSITPASSTVNPSAVVTLTNAVTPANATSPVYAWYSSATNATSGGTLVGGATASTYSPPTTTAGTRWYYGTITAGGATVTSSSAVSVIVRAAPGISAQPASITRAAGGTASFAVTASDGGFPALGYQWQSMPSGGAWGDITGATAAAYSTTTLVNATQYRCVVRNASGAGVSTTSNAATLTVVSPPTITTDTTPLDPAALGGSSVVLSVAATIPGTPAGVLGYQWQSRTSAAGAWANVGGATASTHSATATTDGEQYRCILTNTVNAVAATATSRTTTFTVAAPSAPLFTTQPASVSVAVGAAATFTAAASGVPSPTWQWYDSADGTVFAAIAGATSATYTTPATTAGDAGVPRHYRCVATNASGSATSATVVRTVAAAPTGIAYVAFTTSSAGGTYAPKHVVAAWIQQGATYVATLGDWSGERRSSLVLWNSVRGSADAVMGATRLSHAPLANIAWTFVPSATPDGTYTLWIESADDNPGPIGAASTASVAGANRTSLDFAILGGSVVATSGSGGGFSAVSISPLFDAAAAAAGAAGPVQDAGKVAACGTGGIYGLLLGVLLVGLGLRRRRMC